MDARLEILSKLHIIEEHPGIMILVVESIFKPPDALHRSIHVLVPTKHQQDRICLPELRGEGHYLDCVWSILPILAAEQMRYRRLLTIRFIRETEDRMEADLREVR